MRPRSRPVTTAALVLSVTGMMLVVGGVLVAGLFLPGVVLIGLGLLGYAVAGALQVREGDEPPGTGRDVHGA